ncbi:hypothetical protein CHS0354_031200 [Potamilus streckersoni]|uniref:Uncharacterized protein n=1 Tax=Potamilus streckersoni TaxID=2493646 RepID=A0AAE0TKK7_9BIVA|nr:hypothetical protein CHS0354_031200 [Potamilus streckersoni]
MIILICLVLILQEQGSNEVESVRISSKVGKKQKRWRKYDGYKHWNQMAVSKIRSEIIALIENLEAAEEIKIILCGGTGEGISSLINNICSAIRGSFAVVAQPARDQQVTKRVSCHYFTILT